jgi:hypothetical protein
VAITRRDLWILLQREMRQLSPAQREPLEARFSEEIARPFRALVRCERPGLAGQDTGLVTTAVLATPCVRERAREAQASRARSDKRCPAAYCPHRVTCIRSGPPGTPGTFGRLERRLRNLPFPAAFRSFAPYEAEAAALRMFEHSLVPGLLQTPEYARAVLETKPGSSDDMIDG